MIFQFTNDSFLALIAQRCDSMIAKSQQNIIDGGLDEEENQFSPKDKFATEFLMFDERNYPIKMSNVLDRLFESIQDELVYWKLTNQSYRDSDPVFWTQDKEYKNQNILFRELNRQV